MIIYIYACAREGQKLDKNFYFFQKGGWQAARIVIYYKHGERHRSQHGADRGRWSEVDMEEEEIRRMLAALYVEADKCKSKFQILALIWDVIASL